MSPNRTDAREAILAIVRLRGLIWPAANWVADDTLEALLGDAQSVVLNRTPDGGVSVVVVERTLRMNDEHSMTRNEWYGPWGKHEAHVAQEVQS